MDGVGFLLAMRSTIQDALEGYKGESLEGVFMQLPASNVFALVDNCFFPHNSLSMMVTQCEKASIGDFSLCVFDKEVSWWLERDAIVEEASLIQRLL